MAGLCEGGNEPPDSLKASPRQIQIERSLTPVSERVGVVGRKREKSTASHNVLVSRIFAAAALDLQKHVATQKNKGSIRNASSKSILTSHFVTRDTGFQNEVEAAEATLAYHPVVYLSGYEQSPAFGYFECKLSGAYRYTSFVQFMVQ
ncbi:hypothetical protein ANN_25843 [Periplaneta americana]|uniref:Uncharacterized protein n=1 Tax=Periplaneta americana TaxID=6978 RepID=A0ABQ8S522_PERAM|nr:hypothetical protein ANN_25843 [Periplaneta americana]